MIPPLRRPAAALLLPLLLAACAGAPARPAGVPPVTYVAADTAWSGEVRIDGIVHVRKGATLTIAPGTKVLFGSRAFDPGDAHEGFVAPGILVEGTIVAAGTEEEKILFAPADRDPRPGSWDKILFAFSQGSVFEHCVFRGARYAFHAHFSSLAVRRCLFRDNEEGVRLGTSRATIEESVFTANEVRGINFRECRNGIRRNLVFGNGDGIFLHSKTAGSVIRENAVYGNRGFDLRLGDLHADDVDASGNWWGTAREEEARRKVFDRRNLEGVGAARLDPLLPRPPVGGAEVRGVLVRGKVPVPGATVRAYASADDGFLGDRFVAEAETDVNGLFRLDLPPGRYYVAGHRADGDGLLFAFPGKNPVAAELGRRVDVGMPAVVAPPRPPGPASPSPRTVLRVRVTREGVPVEGASVQAARLPAPDVRGPGEATAVTGEDGTAPLYVPPGRYLVSARKRASGAALGMVEEGGLFGIDPYGPAAIAAGSSLSVAVPLFEKQGLLDEEVRRPDAPPGASSPGRALLSGVPAPGHVVFFYRPPGAVGRPAARSSVTGADGSFTVVLPGDGDFLAWLGKSVPGLPGATEEERFGPVPVRSDGGRLVPGVLPFGSAGAGK